MNKIAERPKSILKRMIEDKVKIVEYLKTKDESKRPEGIKFVKPFSVSSGGKR